MLVQAAASITTALDPEPQCCGGELTLYHPRRSEDIAVPTGWIAIDASLTPEP